MSYHTNLIQLVSPGLLRQSNKGGATEDNNQNLARAKNVNCYAALRLLFFSLSGHQSEEARVRYLETCGAINPRSIQGISQFLLGIQSVQLRNPQSSVSFKIDHLTIDSKSAFNSGNTFF